MKIGWPLYACNEPFRFYPQKISTRGVVHWHGVPKIHKNWILILLPGRAPDTTSDAAVVTGQVFYGRRVAALISTSLEDTPSIGHCGSWWLLHSCCFSELSLPMNHHKPISLHFKFERPLRDEDDISGWANVCQNYWIHHESTCIYHLIWSNPAPV